VIFNILVLILDWQKNSKTNVRKGVLLYFHVWYSCAEMSFVAQNREKVTKYRAPIFSQNKPMWVYQKIWNFMLIPKMRTYLCNKMHPKKSFG
jgi:hypothetical protein